MRIHITGNAGAGKTTLAKLIGAQLSLPVFHLDEVVWMPGWQKATPDVREPREREWVAKPAWVIEGVSREVRKAADVVVLLDVPRYKCAWRCLVRGIRLGLRSRPELPVDCPEIRILPRAMKIIWRFPSLARREIVSELGSSSKFFVITRPEQIDSVLPQLRLGVVT